MFVILCLKFQFHLLPFISLWFRLLSPFTWNIKKLSNQPPCFKSFSHSPFLPSFHNGILKYRPDDVTLLTGKLQLSTPVVSVSFLTWFSSASVFHPYFSITICCLIFQPYFLLLVPSFSLMHIPTVCSLCPIPK